VHKLMVVGVKNGSTSESCFEYCPIDPRDTLKFHPFGYDDTIKDLGPATWNGTSAEHYHWKDKAGKFITLSTVDLYADISDPTAAIPLFKSTAMTPLDMKPLSRSNLTYSNFKPGSPDPSKFDIKDVATCKLSAQCQSPTWQQQRLALGMYHTFANFA
jgi:hypothetical protein